MNYALFALGIIILWLTSTDLIRTALSVRGAGRLSRGLSKFIWKILMVINHNIKGTKILSLGGGIILIGILINWLLLIWLSTSLLFISDPDSIMHVETNTPASVVSKIFYTGYTLSTLGLGDMEPDGAFWEVLTGIMSFAGLVLISIAITYLIPVVSAEIEKRRLSVYITTLGCSVKEILMNHWSNQNFKSLEEPFRILTHMILLHAQNHKAYSVLHYFHSSNKKEAFVLNLTNLDEVLTILLHHVDEKLLPPPHVLMALRKAISGYLVTLPSTYLKPEADSPPVISIDELNSWGFPMKATDKLEVVYEDLHNRRRLLLALIKDDGWRWSDLEAGEYEHRFSEL